MISQIRKWQRALLDFIVRYHPNLGLEERAEFFVRIFESYLPRKSHILDIGGGWGFYAKPLAERGHSAVVLDVVKPSLQKAPLVLYQPGSRFPFPDESFDAAMLMTVLHHIQDPEFVVQEACRVTRSCLIVVEDLYHHPLGRGWTIVRDQLLNMEFFGHPKQFRKKEEWAALVEKHGFKLKAFHPVYTWLSGFRILNGVLIFSR